jgi:hypothetical protein
VSVVVSSSFGVGHVVVVGVGIVDGWVVDIVEAVVDIVDGWVVEIVGLAAAAAEAAVGIRHVAAAVAQQMLDIEPLEQQQQQVLPLPLMLAVAVAVAVQLDDIGLEMAVVVVVELDDS